MDYMIFMINSIVAAGIPCYISESSVKFSKLLSNTKFKNYKMIDGKRYLLELLPSFRVIQQKHNGLLLGFTKCLKHWGKHADRSRANIVASFSAYQFTGAHSARDSINTISFEHGLVFSSFH